ncbi:uncharacterized protein [Diabrotica undecimpunctata]|uniref:uncharacterized protein n=1 Tax=Diabrotica undecimpunctata TaxID=50387 RepID=UPI003B6368F0
MKSQQISVAIICMFLTWQQVAAVVNNNPLKVESLNESSSETTDANKSSSTIEVVDSIAEASEENGNRREASLGDKYGAPLVGGVPGDSYLPAEPSNPNLPIPVYGVPDGSSNNVVYPAPPPDIPPTIPLPSPGFGLSPLGNTYGPPKVNFLPPSNNYGPPNNNFIPPGPPISTYGPPSLNHGPINNNFGPPINTFGPPRPSFPGRPKPVYGPPRFQYGPPGKPISNVKFGFKPPYKNFGGPKYPSKPFNTYGPPVGYFKDNYNPIKFTSSYSGNNIISNEASFGGGGGLNNKYGVPKLEVDLSGVISSQYGVPNLGHTNNVIQSIQSNLISTQYGVPDNDILGGPKPQYGPPQPSSHPKPPHPGAPAPPTPPDIKYDGWQPIPGLISRKPTPVYGAPAGDQHIETDLSYNKDLSPPPIDAHIEHQSNSHASVANLELESSYGPPPQKALSDSYGAPLNTVTGSGGVVSASGEEAHGHGQHDLSHHDHQSNVNIGFSALGLSGQNVNTVKSIGYEIFPNGAATILGGQPSGSYKPPGHSGNSYASGHSYSTSFGSSQHSHGSFNSHRGNGYKGLSFSSSGIGLIPPSGIYGAPSGSYGTPLFSGPKLGPPKHSNAGFLTNTFGSNGHSAISYQNVNHGTSSGTTSYHAPLNTVDGSYNQHQTGQLQGGSQLYSTSQTHGSNQLNVGNEIVSLDYSHPGITIDLTNGHGQNNYNGPYDCKSQSLPSLSYGVPSANSYTAALSSLTTNIGTGHGGASVTTTYGAPEPLPVPQAQIGIKPHSVYGVPDLTISQSQKVNTEVRANSLEHESQDAQGKSYGKTVAASFGPNSELIQSESIDFNNIPLQGSLGSYTLQIQSSDGSQAQVPHGQVLNDGLLQSILAAIEQPKGSNAGQPIIQLQKSLEQQQFVTNDTISSVVEQLTDDEIRQGTQLAKDEIVKSSELAEEAIHYSVPTNEDIEPDTEIQYSSPNQYIITATDDNQLISEPKPIETNEVSDTETETVMFDNSGIALYFSNNQRLKKETKEASLGEVEEKAKESETVQI